MSIISLLFHYYFTIIHHTQTEWKGRKAKGGCNSPPAGDDMKGPTESRSKAIAAMIRKIVAMRQADVSYLDSYMPGYSSRVLKMEKGQELGLGAFVNLMTALRCEVVVVPLGKAGAGGWYRLNDFPDNEGKVLKIPDEVKKGHRKRRTGTDCEDSF